jgi:hypothetical protein
MRVCPAWEGETLKINNTNVARGKWMKEGKKKCGVQLLNVEE